MRVLSIDEQKTIIEKFVKSNKNFKGNEDLYEDFCSESLQKSYLIFNSDSNIQKVESYVAKVVHTSIINVLKNYGRIKRDKKGYTSTKEIKVSDFTQETSSETETVPSSLIWNLPDPKETVEEVLITKECLQNIADSVCVLHKEVPAQQFLNIFYLRYVKGLKQAEIAKELSLSQSEISKRLMRLSKVISNIWDSSRS